MRHQLEVAVLGACLLENKFYLVANVLSYKNFSTPIHAEIFNAMATLYPNQPIDMLTVNKATANKYPHTIANLTTFVCSAANLRYHAYCLLEIDLREKFVALLQPWNDPSGQNKMPALTISVQEVTDEMLDYSNDLFETLEYSKIYLSKFNCEPLTKAIHDFFNAMDKRIYLIKQQAHVDTLVYNLDLLRKSPMQAKPCAVLNKLIDEVKQILITGTVADEKANKILAIA